MKDRAYLFSEFFFTHSLECHFFSIEHPYEIRDDFSSKWWLTLAKRMNAKHRITFLINKTNRGISCCMRFVATYSTLAAPLHPVELRIKMCASWRADIRHSNIIRCLAQEFTVLSYPTIVKSKKKWLNNQSLLSLFSSRQMTMEWLAFKRNAVHHRQWCPRRKCQIHRRQTITSQHLDRWFRAHPSQIVQRRTATIR